MTDNLNPPFTISFLQQLCFEIFSSYVMLLSYLEGMMNNYQISELTNAFDFFFKVKISYFKETFLISNRVSD